MDSDRNFVQYFADIAHPLTCLTSESAPFKWDNDREKAFNHLRKLLASEPVLAFPRLGEPFIVDIEARDHAAGGILMQEGTANELHPVAYYSTAFDKAQQNWAPTTTEAIALVLAVRHWYVYLAGTSFNGKSIDQGRLKRVQKRG